VSRKEARSVRATHETRINKEGHSNWIGSATYAPHRSLVYTGKASTWHTQREKRLFERGVLIVKTKKTKTVEDRAL
jgi:hypothetical protein